MLTAVTLNGAAAIDMADKVGTVEAGKLGDLVIWDAPDLDYICYRFGSNLAKKVISAARDVRAKREKERKPWIEPIIRSSISCRRTAAAPCATSATRWG